MPFLNRLRFVSVGYESARFEDMILDLRGADGKPTDSTLWLRNGGGKSSILNLFFAILRPDSRQFLGTRADSKVRRLEHYIYKKDRSVTACEWELDAGLSKERRCLVTGVFYERKEASGQDDGDLRRFYFGCFAEPAAPASTLEGLPIYAEKDGKRVGRRALNAFKQEWAALRVQQPHLQAVSFENQSDWQEWLEKAGLDPELFNYQLKMNEREGNADELFRFRDTDKFIDFLLGLVVDRRFSEKLRETIATFCEQLHQRKNVQLPEHELLLGLRQQVGPFRDLATRKAAILGKTAQCGRDLRGLQKWSVKASRGLETEAAALDEERRRLEQEAIDLALAGTTLQQEAAAYRRLALQIRRDELQREKELHDRLTKKFETEWKVWEAAVPLRERRHAERDLKAHTEQLEKLKAEHAPLLKELKILGKRFAAALKHDLKKHRAAEEAHHKAKEESAQKAKHLTNDAMSCQAGLSTAKTKAEGARANLKAAERERKVLEERGSLQKGETPAAAQERTKQAVNEAETAIAELRQHEAELSQERSSLRDALQQAQTEQTRKKEQELQALRELAEAQKAKAALEAKPKLAHLLEVDAPDLDVLEDAVLAGIRSAISRLDDEHVEIKVREAHDERAVRYLEERSLLPPTPDVQKVLQAIRNQVKAAWAGWEYIESNVPPNERRLAVERHPHLAAGIIIQDAKFEDAVRAAKSAQLDLEAPVLIAAAGAFKSEQVKGTVIGPAGEAHFNREAGSREEKLRRARLEALLEERKKLRNRRLALQAILEELSAFRKLYAKGWFAQHRKECEILRDAAALAARAVEEAQEKFAQVESQIEACRSKSRTLSDQRYGLSVSLQQLEAFGRNFGNSIEKWEAEAAEQERLVSELDRKRRALTHEIEQAQRLAAHLSDQAMASRLEAERVESRLRDVRYIEGEEVRASEGDVEGLATTYKLASSHYEKKIGADSLLFLIDKFKKDAQDWNGRLRPLLAKSGLTEEKVARALEDLENEAEAEQKMKEAISECASNRGLLSTDITRLREQERSLEKIDALCKGLQVPDDWTPKPTPKDPDALNTLADQKDAQAVERRDKSQHCTQKATQTKGEADDRSRRAESLRGINRTLDSLTADFADILGSDTAIAEFEIEEAEAQERKERLNQELREVRAALGRLAEEREALARKLRLWAGEARFEKAPRETKALVDKIDDPANEAHLGQLEQVVADRLSVLAAQLESSGKNRELIISNTLAEAEKGLEIVKAASRQSKLPDNFRGVGGSQFLKIDFKEPEDGALRRAKMAELVDLWIDAPSLPDGITLVQQAVRKLAGPVRAKALHPDLRGAYVDITEMGRFSGGESLTCAILLFCSLAQLRARQRGTRRTSNVLILDNPIGRSSATNFLELQRAVAQAMRVQLIYTTGVNDYEALRMLPNIIRLRNQRYNPRTGHNVVEIDDRPVNLIEAVRIARLEEPAQDGA